MSITSSINDITVNLLNYGFPKKKNTSLSFKHKNEKIYDDFSKEYTQKFRFWWVKKKYPSGLLYHHFTGDKE